MNNTKVFLGGTCPGDYRPELITYLNQEVNFFNPIRDDWTDECFKLEEQEKAVKCGIHLYVITPYIGGYYSIAEVVDSVHNKDKHTVYCVLKEYQGKQFNKSHLLSLERVKTIVSREGGACFDTLQEVAEHINNRCLSTQYKLRCGL